jgi:hypothetical protein
MLPMNAKPSLTARAAAKQGELRLKGKVLAQDVDRRQPDSRAGLTMASGRMLDPSQAALPARNSIDIRS